MGRKYRKTYPNWAGYQVVKGVAGGSGISVIQKGESLSLQLYPTWIQGVE